MFQRAMPPSIKVKHEHFKTLVSCHNTTWFHCSDLEVFVMWSKRYEDTSTWRDIETHTSYQHHNFHTTGLNALKLYVAQVETCTNMSLPRSSKMASLKSRNKIIPGTSEPHLVYTFGSYLHGKLQIWVFWVWQMFILNCPLIMPLTRLHKEGFR
jgi:hypothetical protein